MKLIVLGSGTAVPHSQRASPGYVLDFGEHFLLLDPGPGSLHRMVRLGYDFLKLKHVVLSHFHCDHATDLISLFFARNVPTSIAPPRLTLLGPEGLYDYYERMLVFLGHWVDQGERIQLQELLDGEDYPLPELNGRIQARQVAHSGTSLGFRFIGADDRALAYSGDSEWCPALAELVHEADLALLECSSPSNDPLPGHMTPREIARLGARANPSRILLTHLYPSCDGHDLCKEVEAAGYAGAVEVAVDGRVYS